MPEGPEAHTIGDIVYDTIGLQFEKAEIIERSDFKHKYARNGLKNLDKLSNGFKIDDAFVRGKLVVINLDVDGQHWVILNTLGMSGTWMFHGRSNYHARINFANGTRGGDSGVIDFTFVDQRSFGTIKICKPDEAQKKIRKIGHDLVSAPMADGKWAKLQEKLGHKEIGIALMEQKHFSGIGNIYKAEILYAIKIHPKTLIKDLSKDTWSAVNYTSHLIMKRAYTSGGSTVRSFAANGKIGKFQRQLKVYKRKKCPEGHPIVSVDQKKRTTWFCKECQR